MGFASNFVASVVDPFRGSNTTPSNAVAHGGGFTSPNPAVAAWLDRNTAIAQTLGRIQDAVAALDGRAEGCLTAFTRARERYDESKAAESRAQYAAREIRQSVDPELAKRLATARMDALAGNEAAADRSHIASQDFAATRDTLNETIKFIGGLAAERRTVKLAPAAKLPKGPIKSIVAEQRRILAELDSEADEVTSAPIPLEDAVDMIRADARGAAPHIIIDATHAGWEPNRIPLNAAPRLGAGQVLVDDAVSLMAWALGDVLADKLEAAVRQRYAGVERTFTPLERRRALTALAARRLQVERIEVAALMQMWAEGDVVALRKGTSPMALLGIESIGEPAKDPEGYIGSAYMGDGLR